MRILVCGDRNWTNWRRIADILYFGDRDITIIHGHNGYKSDGSILKPHESESLAIRGADAMAGVLARDFGYKVERFPYLGQYGKTGGPIRNRQMLDTKPDLVIAFHNNIKQSRGTKDCVYEAVNRGIVVLLITDKDIKVIE